MHTLRCTLLILIVMSLCSTAGAQVATVAEKIQGPFPTDRKHEDLATLTKLYNSGKWAELQKLATDVIGSVAASGSDEVKSALQVKSNHVALMWIGDDAFGTTLLMRVVVHDPAPDQFETDLPGLGTSPSLIEVMVAKTVQGRATSVYASTREKDPASDVLPLFIQGVAGPLFQTFATLAPVKSATWANEPPSDVLFATVKHVGLPFRRAAVTLKTVARDPYFDSDSFAEAVTKLAAAVKFNDVGTSACARAFASKLDETLAKNVDATCTANSPDFATCRAKFDAFLAGVYLEERAKCAAGPFLDGDLEAVAKVDRGFRDLVASSLSNSAELSLTFHNRPRTRFAFGGGTGLLLGKVPNNRPRVKLDSGILVADPLSRVVTTAFVNFSPAGYDAESNDISGKERVRAFFGVTMTPNFGVVVGGNFLLARGIGLSLGYGALFANGANTEELNMAPANPKDSYRLSVSRAPFVGITYNYK